ncbi:MAG TPA: hypothetical protein VFS43_31170 [Polyangiaceae bacterium]|nr:hypothetical protein [Polyangiaceae bacterium]
MSHDTLPIHRLIEDLPQAGVTPAALSALDYLVPGQWVNVTVFEEMIRHVTGETDDGLIQQVGERAIALYNDPNERYQRAVWAFQAVDSLDKAAGMAALANRVGDKISFLSFLDKITPEPDTVQALDLAVKVVAELACFCLVNGLPGDSVGDFAASLANYEREDAIRLAALVSFDGVIPLGPDFLAKAIDAVQNVSDRDLFNHGAFAKLRSLLPGGEGDQRALVQRAVEQAAGPMRAFVEQRGVTREGLLEKLRHVIEISDDKLDYLAAALDMTTNYFEHTGIQSVARRLVSRAYGEI